MRWRRVVFGRPRRRYARRSSKSLRRKQPDAADSGVGVVLAIGFVVVFWLASYYQYYPTIVSIVAVVIAVFVVLAILGKKHEKQQKQMQQEERSRQLQEERRKLEEQEEERKRQREEKRRKRAEQREEERKREEQERAEQIEALLERDAFRESVDDMSGVEFENFMANALIRRDTPYRLLPPPAIRELTSWLP